MSNSGNLKVATREKVGSRDARKLRAAGRIPASLQTDGEKPHVNLHLDEVEFLTSRRKHVHLYDLDFGGNVESAVVRELQWDALGSNINHIEFKRVTRGVATESEVELAFRGQIKSGLLTHATTHLTILCLPSLIPDAIEVIVQDLEEGAHITAGDLTLPEGVTLAVDPDTDVCHISAMRGEVEEVEEEDEGAGPEVLGEESPTE